MSQHRRSMDQHWVDRAYLEVWCDPNCPEEWEPFVWVFDATTRKGRRRAPKNIFKEPHMYTMPEGGKGDPLSLEKSLQKLCDEFLRVRDAKVWMGENSTDRTWRGCACSRPPSSPALRRTVRTHVQRRGHMADVVEDLAKGSVVPGERDQCDHAELGMWGHLLVDP